MPTVFYLTNWSTRRSAPALTWITSQTGLDLPESQSRPEPDLMWLRAARYRDAHPRGSDVQLAIEVAYSSLACDLKTKRRLYAESNIVEYWIVDAQAQCIHVHRHPVQGDHQERSVSTFTDSLSPMIQASAKLNLNDLFLG